ncbi:hypothetical protein CA54_13730 [Symmachiella macrocystis]|uniref:Uncharacterized protein n=1 Tax=Symmachiella macrocystis TaxID=2527985 RepID=A0A5C6BN81_9PLAN|nr:hypothetical protein [Symmachiella macrocystis]TWU12549.1 hypothetical protein CA54_13730 [Symmachiella macrocystis]
MRERRIILVDGMPGTGKSTLSQFIFRQLRSDGQPVEWYHEESGTHPVRLFYEPQRHRSWSNYCDEVVLSWQRFVRELGSGNDVAVIDAAVLQNHVRSLLIYDCDRDLIVDLVLRIEKVITALNPVLIYLTPRDIESNFRDVVESRGQRLMELWTAAHDQYPYSRSTGLTGYAGFIKFWKEFDEISNRVFARIGFKKLRQRVSHDDWKTRYAEVLDDVGIPRSESVSAANHLERFAGDYQMLEDRSATTFRLRPHGDSLVATVDQPTFDIQSGPFGCFRQVRLIPQARNEFYVAAWPHVVCFAEDATGLITSLSVNNSSEGWPPCQFAYCKS